MGHFQYVNPFPCVSKKKKPDLITVVLTIGYRAASVPTVDGTFPTLILLACVYVCFD